jgi:tRNA 2-selenouridine synthase
MDVRAPVEYEKGSFPSACNIPLMTNDERHEVGLCYKEKGQDAAIELGHQLVSGRTREERTRQWIAFAEAHPSHGYLYCFRGGLRSQLVQRRLLEETGIHYPLVTGGYKAMRQFLLEELDRSLETAELILVAGQTGAGKTRVIQKLPNIDLEGLAHHRGSTFGRWPEDPLQPSQIDFENSVSIALLKLLDPSTSQETPSSSSPKPWVFVEDEGNRIGNLVLPVGLRTQMKASKFVVVEEDMEERVNVILEDYVFDLGRRFAALHGQEEGRVQHREFLLGGVHRLRKRLGGDRYAELNYLLQAAIKEHEDKGDVTLHRVFVEVLLKEYYDPMYDYQLDQREGQVLFRGKGDAVVEWAAAEALKR